MTATPVRRTQEERRATTRAKLLDAAAACLLERGYAATTVGEVQERAGVARGTLLHHFPTKVDLMVAATGHVTAQRIEGFRKAAAAIPEGDDRLDAVIDLAWQDLNGPVFFTALELWVAARTDADLRAAVAALEEELFRSMRESYAEVLGDSFGDATYPIEFTIDLLTGLSITTMVSGQLGPRQRVLDRWKKSLRMLIEEQS
ncbi:MAG TPA: TetR/AcrR family transcriptional regulator [Nocardioidaceae bacterium]|nr:TetR/AcrR family transcriptional regulator [Nocardioidaceae bacterium]